MLIIFLISIWVKGLRNHSLLYSDQAEGDNIVYVDITLTPPHLKHNSWRYFFSALEKKIPLYANFCMHIIIIYYYFIVKSLPSIPVFYYSIFFF